MSGFVFDPVSPDDRATQRIKFFNAKAKELREQGIRPGESPAPTPSYSDRELGLRILQDERKMSEIQAFRALETRPELLAELAPDIERLRDFRTRMDAERIERERAASPDAMLLAASEAQDAERRNAERVEAGKALLRSNPERFGIAPEMVDQLAPDEVLIASKIVQTPDPAGSLAENLKAAGQDGGEAA